MIRRLPFLLMITALLVAGMACSGTADDGGEKSSSLPAPSPGDDKADSTTRRTDIRGSLEFGDQINADIEDTDRYVGYTFGISGDASVEVEVVSGQVDPAVWVYGPQEDDGDWGRPVAENDDIDWPDNENARIEDLDVEEAGTYLAVVGTSDYSGGQFRLGTECIGDGCGASDDGSGDSDQCAEDLSVAHKVGVGRAGSFVEGTQSGKDIEVVGETAYMANMQKGICRFDIADPLEAELLGCVSPPSDGTSSHRVHDILIAGNAMYVLNSLEGLWVYDLSDPENPSVIGTFRDAEYFGMEMTLAGDHLYLAARRSGTHILDVSNPSTPTLAGHLDDNGAPSPADESASYATHMIAVDGEIGYFAQRKGGLGIYDLSEPTDPRELGRYLPEKADGADHRPSVMAVHLEGERAFVAAANDTSNLHLLDVGHPEHPELVWADQASSERRYWTKDTLGVSDDHIALSRGDDRGIELFRRDDEGTPSHLGTVDPDGSPEDLHVTDDGSVLYAASANTLRNPRGHLMGLGVIPASCE